eukprot:1544844-Pyramimonas_sp.AAC.1
MIHGSVSMSTQVEMETRMSLFAPWPRRPGRRHATTTTMLPLLVWRTVGVNPASGCLLWRLT